MGHAIDITGERYGKLTATTPTRNSKGQHAWVCRCDCGRLRTVIARELRSGNTRSCGCAMGRRTHGCRWTRTYKVWINMRSRCNNPNRPDYEYYGGRGITVAPEWDDYAVFLLDMGEAPPGLTIDRKDNDLGYSKSNCRWATRLEQSRNRRCAR